jgi:hypothetical protein
MKKRMVSELLEAILCVLKDRIGLKEMNFVFISGLKKILEQRSNNKVYNGLRMSS